MKNLIQSYKSKYHFSVNFYSLFLIVTFIPDLSGINSGLIKYSYWGIKVLLALLVIIQNKRSLLKPGLTEIIFFSLALIYAIRIFMDVFVYPATGIPKADWSYEKGVMDFIGFCLGIFIAISFRYNPVYHAATSFNFFWITITIALILAWFLSFPSLDLDVKNVRYDANSTINSIMYGQTGCALAIISIPAFFNNKKWLFKIVALATMFLGLLSIAKAGSRSPVIVFILIGIIYFIARMGIIKGSVITALLISLIVTFIKPIIDLMESMGSSLPTRLNSMVTEKETSGRDYIYSNAWKLIGESPFFGSYYVLKSGPGAGGYPHNFFLEVFLATGLVGGIPFLILLFITCRKAFKIIQFNSSATWVALLYLQIIVYGMFSTGLYTSQDFWTLMFFFASMTLTVFTATAKKKGFIMPKQAITLKLSK